MYKRVHIINVFGVFLQAMFTLFGYILYVSVSKSSNNTSEIYKIYVCLIQSHQKCFLANGTQIN